VFSNSKVALFAKSTIPFTIGIFSNVFSIFAPAVSNTAAATGVPAITVMNSALNAATANSKASLPVLEITAKAVKVNLPLNPLPKITAGPNHETIETTVEGVGILVRKVTGAPTHILQQALNGIDDGMPWIKPTIKEIVASEQALELAKTIGEKVVEESFKPRND